ncbi:MAG: hypothetical protein PHP92_03755 [Candidatus Nanoarchaeia archaeon]|nr:hypothetical protein [Candidatus Nanoarchaeia archaeon]
MKIIKYELSKDKKGLRGYFKDNKFYHIHSDEMTITEKLFHKTLLALYQLSNMGLF